MPKNEAGYLAISQLRIGTRQVLRHLLDAVDEIIIAYSNNYDAEKIAEKSIDHTIFFVEIRPIKYSDTNQELHHGHEDLKVI